MSRAKRIQGREWTAEEVKALKQLVKENTPTRVIGLKLGRSATAIYSKAGGHFTKADKPIALRLI